MKIGIDFDRVLFKTDEFKEHLEQKIEGFMEHYPEGVYDHVIHAEKLGVEAQEIIDALGEASRFVYEDVEKLEELVEHELVLVSRGDPVFQLKKIEQSGIQKIFERVEVVEEGAKDRFDIDMLVDDSLEELERIKVEGFHFDRSKHTVENIIQKVREHET